MDRSKSKIGTSLFFSIPCLETSTEEISMSQNFIVFLLSYVINSHSLNLFRKNVSLEEKVGLTHWNPFNELQRRQF